MKLGVRFGKALDKYVWDRTRHPRAAEVTSGVPGTFDALKGRKYALLVTFKRDGEAMPTPTWFGLGEDGNFYMQTFADAWKVKRIARDPRALVAPSDPRGKPLGQAIEGRARVLPESEWDRAESAIQANYGVSRKLYMVPVRNETDATAYIEVTPTPWADA